MTLRTLLPWTLVLWGCTDLAPTNPYDPASPVELQRKASIAGVVTSSATEATLVGAVVSLSGPTDPDNNPLTTEADGVFRFVDLVPGRYVLAVRHAGHAPREIDLGQLAAAEAVDRSIIVEPLGADSAGPGLARLSGVAHKIGELALEEASARDHSGVTVEVEGEGVRTVTNRAGEFDLFLNAGTYALVLTAPNHVRLVGEPIELSPGEERRLEDPFVLQSDPGEVRGVVLLEGAAGDAHGDITVSLANTSATTTTDGSGAFRLDDVPAGVYTLRAARGGFDTQSVGGVVVESHPPTVLDPITLAISRGGVRGAVGLAASPSAAGIAVELVDTAFRTLTNDAGDYRIDGIPVGEYTLRACRQGYEPHESAVTIRAQQSTIAPPEGEETTLARQQIRLDDDGSIAIERAHTLRFEAVPAWATEVRVTGDLDPAEPTDYRPFDAEARAVAVTLSEGEGSKLLNVELRGDGCHQSDVHQIVVVFDSTGPTLATVEVAEGAVTSQAALTLRVQAIDATEIRVSGDLQAVAGEAANVGAWIPASARLAIRLEDEADGDKTITVEARDGAGNLSLPESLVAMVLLDRAPPQGAEIAFDGPQPLIEPMAALRLTARGATQMQISNDAAFADAVWGPFEARVAPWSLAEPDADGPKTVYARFRDAAGNTTDAVSARVTLDREGEVGGALRLEGTDACGGAEVRIDGVPVDAEWRGCDFTITAVPVGLRAIRIDRPGFQSAVLGARAVSPTGRVELGDVLLARARGTASGAIRLQGRPEDGHGGTLLSFRNASDPIGEETLPDYVATTLPDGSFFSEGMWAGRYVVRATKEGFSARELGEHVVTAGADTRLTPPEEPVVLTQQVGDFLIDDGAGFTRDPRVDLRLDFNDVVRFRIRVDGADFSEWIDYAPDGDGSMVYRDLDLGADDGVKRVELETEDANRIRSGEPYFQASIILDTQAPTAPSITVDGGAAYTNSPLGRVVLTLSADDPNGVDRVRLSGADDCAGEGPAEVFSPVMNHELEAPGEDGEKQIYACFIDPAGNVSASANAGIVLDTTAPTLQGFAVRDHAGRVCGDACLVNDPRVALVLTEAVAGDAREIRLSRDDASFASGAWQSLLPGDVPFELPRQSGPYTLYVKARDAAGNVSAVAELTLTLDRDPPPIPSAVAAHYVRVPRLSVALSNIAGVARVETSWGADFGDPEGHDPAAQLDVDLPGGAAPGTHTLRLRYVDAAGNRSDAVGLVTVYDTEAPQIAGATLGNGAPGDGVFLAQPLAVPLQVVCLDDRAAQGELELVLEGQVRAFAPLIAVDLPNDEGAGRLEVRCTDPAGNESAAVEIDYVLDTVRPAAEDNALEIEGGRSHVNQRAVVLTLQTADNAGGSGVGAIALANGAIDCDTADFREVADAIAWVLPEGDGSKTVAACIRDRAGNLAQTSDDVVLDTQAPAGDFTFAEGTHSQAATVSVLVTREDADAAKMRIGEGVLDCAAFLPAILDDGGADFSAVAQPLEFGGEGLHQASVCLYDRAGNAARVTHGVTVDLTDPTGNMDLDRGAPYAASRDVTLNLSASADVVSMKVQNRNGPAQAINCAADAGYIPLDLAYAHSLTAGDGPKYVRVCLRDASGRTVELPGAAEAAYDITLDATPPALGDPGSGANDGLWLEGGAAITNSASIQVAVSATDATAGVDEFKLSAGDACTGGGWQDWTPDEQGRVSTQFAIAPGDNVERAVSVLFRDAAGNTSGCAAGTIDIDVVPLSITEFAVRGGAEDAAGYTSTLNLNVSSIGHDGVGTCARYEVSENNAFPAPPATTRYANCPAGELAYTIRDAASDGAKRLYARVIDAAGNASSTLQATIELDRGDPTLRNVRIAQGPNARPLLDDEDDDELRFSDRQDVSLSLVDPSGGVRVRYALLEDGNQACPAAADLAGRADLAPTFTVRFADQGLKKICAAIEDAVGNVSDVHSGTVEVDLDPPNPPVLPRSNLPGVNASCAYVEAARDDVDDFWKFEARSAGGQWFELDDDTQDPADIFDSNNPIDTAHIKFALTQDVDNLLQIRVVDLAGNRSEASEAIVEEVSSFLIPTDLRMKQVCNGGQYAILKEGSGTVGSYRRSTCFPDKVLVEDAPEHAILDLDRLLVRSLSPSLNLSDLADASCKSVALNTSVLDAACSPEADEPALLIARPETSSIVGCFTGGPNQPCRDIVAFDDDLGIHGEIQMLVLPDPIGEPLAPSVALGPLRNGSSRFPVRSIDVLDWLGDLSAEEYDFRAVSTDVEKVYTRNVTVFGVTITSSWRTNVRRLRTSGNPISQVLARDPYTYVEGEGNFGVRGLSIYGNAGHYLKFDPATDPDRWRLWTTTGHGLAGSAQANVTDAFEDLAVSPFRSRIVPAHWYHVNNGDALEGRGNIVYLHTNGSARARRANNNGEQVLGTGAPDGAAFFEVGEDEVYWVDAQDPRMLYESSTYGQNPIRLRYAVDAELPIFPALASTGQPGEPYVLYHTSGVTRGVVLAYSDENDEANDECAR